MKNTILLILIILPITAFSQANANKILGVWLTEIKDGKVEIYKKGSKFYGRIVWMKEPNDEKGQPQTDNKNPDESLKPRQILRMDIITGLVYEDGEWSGGNIYDPKSGDTYDCKIWLEDGKLKLRGYLGWFYDTKTWTKA